MKKIIISIAILVAGFSAANAQSTSTASQTVTLTLANSIALSLTSGTGNSFLFDDVTKYQDGLTNVNASTFLVKSNRPWAVTVKAAAASFTGAATTVMPSTVLGIRMASTTSFTPLTATAAALTSGLRGSSNFTIDYNATPGFLYDAGAYTLSVVYTATQQ